MLLLVTKIPDIIVEDLFHLAWDENIKTSFKIPYLVLGVISTC